MNRLFALRADVAKKYGVTDGLIGDQFARQGRERKGKEGGVYIDCLFLSFQLLLFSTESCLCNSGWGHGTGNDKGVFVL